MPRNAAVTRVDVNTSTSDTVSSVVAFIDAHPSVRLVAEDGSAQPLTRELLNLLRHAGLILCQGHDVDVLDASSDDLTPNEAADLIGISRPTLLKLIDDGVLTATNVPGSAHRRLDRVEVEEFRDSRRAMQTGLSDAAAEARATGLFARTSRRR